MSELVEKLKERIEFNEDESREYADNSGEIGLYERADAFAHHLAGAHLVNDSLRPILEKLIDCVEALERAQDWIVGDEGLADADQALASLAEVLK
jgi:hypothetical protein